MISIGLIGFGAWGPNLARCIAASPTARLVAICDNSNVGLASARQLHPHVRAEPDWRALVHDPRIDALIVATPATTHFEIGIAALNAGKHVLVEKPLACNSDEALQLVNASEKKQRVLMVDHTYLFSAPVGLLRGLLGRCKKGEPIFYHSERLGRARGCFDVNVLWDLAVHDLSIVDYLFETPPEALRAVTSEDDGALLSLFFSCGSRADIHVGWNAASKIRKVEIKCAGTSFYYDDLAPVEKIRVVETKETAGGGELSWCPAMKASEPLAGVVEHFAGCVIDKRRPLSDGLAGMRAVRLLEAADRSLAASGRLEPCG